MFKGLGERGMSGLRGVIWGPLIMATGIALVDLAVVGYDSITSISKDGVDLTTEKSASEIGKTEVEEVLPKLFIHPKDTPLWVWIAAATGGAGLGLVTKKF